MSARKCLGCALIAGMTMGEGLSSPPGLIFDVYFARRDYDDVMHGIRRRRETDWGEDV